MTISFPVTVAIAHIAAIARIVQGRLTTRPLIHPIIPLQAPRARLGLQDLHQPPQEVPLQQALHPAYIQRRPLLRHGHMEAGQ